VNKGAILSTKRYLATILCAVLFAPALQACTPVQPPSPAPAPSSARVKPALTWHADRDQDEAVAVATSALDVSFPMDIVPDGFDDNDLALNPHWNFQQVNSTIPDVSSLCGGLVVPFTGSGSHVMLGVPSCVSMPVELNLIDGATDATLGLFGLCQAPNGNGLNGHANWEPVTIEGALQFDEFDHGDTFDSFAHDQDYNVYIVPPNDGLLTVGDARVEDGSQAHKIEFAAPETIELYDTPFWQEIWVAPHILDGRPGIVTGLFGIDGVHTPEGSEIHPAWAFSANLSPVNECDGVVSGAKCGVDEWAAFVRSYGNEGNCSDHDEVLDIPSSEGFKVRYPWNGPKGLPVTIVTHAEESFENPTDIPMLPGGIKETQVVQDESITVTYDFVTNRSNVAADLTFVYGSAPIFDFKRASTNQGGWTEGGNFVSADFTGDGLPDMAFIFEDNDQINVDVHPNLGNGTFGRNERWADHQGGWAEAGGFFAGDFNGDGRPDIAYVFEDNNQISIDVHPNTGNRSFGVQERWSDRQGGWTDGGWPLAGDFTGDGRPDIAFAFDDNDQINIDVHPNTGNRSFSAQERWADHQGGWTDGGKFLVGDFTGDGLADVAFFFEDNNQINIDVHPNTGNRSFAVQQRWADHQGGWTDTSQLVAGDFDSDGHDDIAYLWRDEALWFAQIPSKVQPRISIDVHSFAAKADGSPSFVNRRWSTQMGGWVDDGMVWMGGDFDGDGAIDLGDAFKTDGDISIDLHRNLNVPPHSLPERVLNDGALGFWRLDEKLPNTGNPAIDSAPAHNNGTYLGTYTDATPPASPSPVLEQPGATLADSDASALFYISNNYAHTVATQTNYVSIPNNPNQAPSRAELTLEAWFTMTPGATPQTYSAIISKSTANWQDGYGLYWYAGSLYFFINNLNIRIGASAAMIGDASQFHHVVGVYDGTSIKIYLDGALAGTRTLVAREGKGLPVNAGSGAFQIGKGWVNLGWQGRLDDVAFYDHALSAAQVQAHFRSARPAGPLMRKFVAYADRSLTLGTGVHVNGGDLGVASAVGAGPQLTVGASDVIDPQRTLFSPSVSLGAQAQVGPVATNALTNAGATLGARQIYPASAMPRVPLSISSATSSNNVTVAQGRTLIIYPGSYGTLTCNGNLRLSPGTYSFSSITLGDGATIVALPWGNTTVHVASSFRTGASVSIAQGSGIAGAFTISIAGSDSLSSRAADIGASNQIVALVAAPSGTVAIGDNTAVTGALAASSIVVGANAILKYDSGIPPVGAL
jgi:hypothetical protein